ncbi:MAG: gluconolactonase [Acidobacteria bacterium OLB17]|nr:MAG: gluconolactonase [Acidobacteria bacterium OLB17]MCZ2389799.1 gluconolaconase [Acidobacteriota bacterium]
MGKAGTILSVTPPFALPGAEIIVACEGFELDLAGECGLFAGERQCQTVAASRERVIARLPKDLAGGAAALTLRSGGESSAAKQIVVGRMLADDMHLVANPAVDPSDDSLILTRSGSRGQQLPVTLFRLETDGFLDEFPEAIMNPTSVAFNRDGELFVTNRAEGEVYQVDRSGSYSTFAMGLGIASGLAFDKTGVMYVGDRTGTIFRVHEFSDVEPFAAVEPSVAAHHLAFSPNGELYLTAPGFASKDGIYKITSDGAVSMFYGKLGRPQGMAFDISGDMYVAACHQGRRGIVKIKADGSSVELLVSGDNVVGLCFTRQGEMVVATGDIVYSIPCGIYGAILSQ